MPWMASVAPHTADDPKQQLPNGALGYLTEHGIGDISLRELAAALGTSHRMLIYHFGSKEGLFVAVVQEAENRQRQLLANLFGGEPADFAASARRFWQQMRSPELAPLERLFFELYGQALQGRSYALPILAGFIDSWVQPLIPALMAAGLRGPGASRGAARHRRRPRPLLDVLATGDATGADEAYERYMAASAALPRSTPRHPALPGPQQRRGSRGPVGASCGSSRPRQRPGRVDGEAVRTGLHELTQRSGEIPGASRAGGLEPLLPGDERPVRHRLQAYGSPGGPGWEAREQRGVAEKPIRTQLCEPLAVLLSGRR